MANLFYKVTNERADQFKNSMAQEGVIGFVEGQDGFGYLLANGHQYGPTKSQITSLIGNVTKPTVSSTSTTFKDQDGNEISLAVGEDGKLLLSKYTAANWTTLSINAPKTSHNDAVAEYGSYYILSAEINFNESAGVGYTISPGTETISNRKIFTTYYAYNGDEVNNTFTLDRNDGTVNLNLSHYSVNKYTSGYAISPTSISVSSKVIKAIGQATGSVKGVFSKSAKQEEITVTATLTVQERWIQHTADITVSTPGNSTTANGSTFLAGTVTTGTKKLVNLDSKPTSFTATEGQKCYLAFKKTWGTPSFKDPNGFDNTAWKVAHDISIYGTNDYSVYVFVGTDDNPANMNAAGAGTWKVLFK